VREGAAVRIQYTAMQTSKAGRFFKGLEVYVADARAEVESVRHPAQFLTRAAGEEG